MMKQNIQYKRCIIGIFVVILILSSSSDVIAEKITVYVKDQNGIDVSGNSHLIGDLRVEL